MSLLRFVSIKIRQGGAPVVVVTHGEVCEFTDVVTVRSSSVIPWNSGTGVRG